MIGAGSMRRVLLLLLTVFLASGTIAGSIAHAIEERAEMSQPAMMLDSGCLSASVADVAEPEKQSSPDDQKQTPTAPHGCQDRKSVGSGKSVSVRVDLGGRRMLKKKKKMIQHNAPKTIT